MLKRTLIIFILCFLLLAGSAVIFRNIILKFVLERYLNRSLEVRAAISRAHFSLKSVTLEGLNISGDGFKGECKDIAINFYFPHFLKPKISRVVFKNASVAVEDLKSARGKIKEIRLKLKKKPLRPAPDKESLTLNLGFENIHLKIKQVDSFYVESSFNGAVRICFKGGLLSDISGGFRSTRGGLIKIDREAPLKFLRRYLDEESYRILIDNFKNYAYGTGRLDLSKKEGFLTVALDFNSQKSGRRDIQINFHNVLGK